MKPNHSSHFPKTAIVLYVLLVAGMIGTYWIYPKHQQKATERMISWDIAGYYAYLPAIFIYQDLKKAAFLEDIQREYRPSGSSYETVPLPNGNRTMKYSMGMAIQYLPAFGAGHLAALLTHYPADGYSQPYQVAMILWCFLVAFAGLYMLRLVLRKYFSETATALTLVGIALGTNYLNYAIFEGAMSHNFLFTGYALLLWLTQRFHERPSMKGGIYIGLVVGLMALSRPTEIVAACIPLLWGLSRKDWRAFYRSNWKGYLLAGLACLAVGSLQLIYWKYVSGHWLVYSYGSQGFDWHLPHFWRAVTGYQIGWLTYSPLLILALIGFVWLWIYHHPGRWAITGFFLCFAYLALAWSEWEYGGSLGHRAFIQSYAVLAIPMAFVWEALLKNAWTKWFGVTFLAINLYFTTWQIYGAHGPGPYEVDIMNNRYFWAAVCRWQKDPDLYRLLDTDEVVKGDRINLQVLASEGFSKNNAPCDTLNPNVWCLTKQNQFSPPLGAHLEGSFSWGRFSCLLMSRQIETYKWQLAQVNIFAFSDGVVLKQKQVKAQRFMKNNVWQEVYVDIKLPSETDSVAGHLWHADSNTELMIDSMWLEGFSVK